MDGRVDGRTDGWVAGRGVPPRRGRGRAAFRPRGRGPGGCGEPLAGRAGREGESRRLAGKGPGAGGGAAVSSGRAGEPVPACSPPGAAGEAGAGLPGRLRVSSVARPAAPSCGAEAGVTWRGAGPAAEPVGIREPSVVRVAGRRREVRGRAVWPSCLPPETSPAPVTLGSGLFTVFLHGVWQCGEIGLKNDIKKKKKKGNSFQGCGLAVWGRSGVSSAPRLSSAMEVRCSLVIFFFASAFQVGITRYAVRSWCSALCKRDTCSRVLWLN